MSGFHPDATILLGPGWKTGYPGISERVGRGAVFHSMEGSYVAALARLEGSDQVSWHFSVPKLGDTFFQHYGIEQICWQAGSAGANEKYFGIEHEGVAGEPLTEHQIECDVSILAWAMDNDVEHWPGFTLRDTLFEHCWLYATACPSGRIPWDEVISMATLFEQMQARLLSLEQYREMAQATFQGQKTDIANLVTGQSWLLGGIKALMGRVHKLDGQ